MSPTTIVALLLLSALAAVSWAQSDCQGKVGAYAYDLRPLAAKLGNVDLQAYDSAQRVYYYHVCGAVRGCQTMTDSTPATCQKDSRIPAQYHDLGNKRTARFGQLLDSSEREGFTLSFTGGEEGRTSVIHYQWYVGRFNCNCEATTRSTVQSEFETFNTFYSSQ
jgi:hypothetical protein